MRIALGDHLILNSEVKMLLAVQLVRFLLCFSFIEQEDR